MIDKNKIGYIVIFLVLELILVFMLFPVVILEWERSKALFWLLVSPAVFTPIFFFIIFRFDLIDGNSVAAQAVDNAINHPIEAVLAIGGVIAFLLDIKIRGYPYFTLSFVPIFILGCLFRKELAIKRLRGLFFICGIFVVMGCFMHQKKEATYARGAASLVERLERYMGKNGRYPTSLSDLGEVFSNKLLPPTSIEEFSYESSQKSICYHGFALRCIPHSSGHCFDFNTKIWTETCSLNK
jgi:hypothetical protein